MLFWLKIRSHTSVYQLQPLTEFRLWLCPYLWLCAFTTQFQMANFTFLRSLSVRLYRSDTHWTNLETFLELFLMFMQIWWYFPTVAKIGKNKTQYMNTYLTYRISHRNWFLYLRLSPCEIWTEAKETPFTTEADCVLYGLRAELEEKFDHRA